MQDNLFKQLSESAENRELQVRVAAAIASAAANYMVQRIESASKGAEQAFIGLMEPYWQNFQFYADLQHKLEQRCSDRQEMNHFERSENTNIRNLEMFGAIAADLNNSNREVQASPLFPAPKEPNTSRSEKLHTALHLVELAAALNHNTLAFGHMIGPLVGLVLGIFEREEHQDTRDPFSDTSQFLAQLNDIDKHLRKIAVGVYRVPNFWPTPLNLSIQRDRRDLPMAENLRASEPLTVDEAEGAVSQALRELRQKKLGVSGQ